MPTSPERLVDADGDIVLTPHQNAPSLVYSNSGTKAARTRTSSSNKLLPPSRPLNMSTSSRTPSSPLRSSILSVTHTDLSSPQRTTQPSCPRTLESKRKSRSCSDAVSDFEFGSGSDVDDRDTGGVACRVVGIGNRPGSVRRRRSCLRDTQSGTRDQDSDGDIEREPPSKKVRVDDGALVLASGDGKRMHTPTREREKTPAPMAMSVSPLPRPSSSRFQSSDSNSSAGTPFPGTPSSNGSGSSYTFNVPSSPQPFWFEDGDLVLLISARSSSSPPFFPSTISSSSLPPAFSTSYQHPSALTPLPHSPESPSPPSVFRIHAARLALVSSAFASLLACPIPASPTKDDSIRASREIARRLSVRARGRRGSGTDNSSGDYDHSKSKVGNVGRDAKVKDEDWEEEYECVGGCPAIILEGDSPRDWVVALEAIYEPMSFQIRPVVFDTLAGVLRVATRYGVSQQREWAIAQLRTTWPTHVERMAPVALPHAADAIALARACDVPEILPAAFYALAVQRWRPSPVHTPGPSAVVSGIRPSNTPSNFIYGRGCNSAPSYGSSGEATGGTDGGRAHLVLDPVDMRRLVAGREALQDILVEIVASPLVIGRCMLPASTDAEDRSGAKGAGLGFDFVENMGEMNVNATYPLSPAPSPSPKIHALGSVGASALHVPSPVLSSDSSTAMVSDVDSAPNLSSSFHQPTPAPAHAQSMGSFCPFPGFASSTSSFGFSDSVTVSSYVSFTSFTMKTPPSTSSSAGTGTSTSTIMSPPPRSTFCPSGSSTCRSALEMLWRARLVSDGRRAWGTWLARELHRLSTLPRGGQIQLRSPDGGSSLDGAAFISVVGTEVEPGAGGIGMEEDTGKETGNGKGGISVCVRCWEENRRLALWRLDWFCAAIPGMFVLEGGGGVAR